MKIRKFGELVFSSAQTLAGIAKCEAASASANAIDLTGK
jgi:hypothetical protein